MTETKIFFDRDLDASVLSGKQIGLIGYGSQGRAQALNLRDSGFTPLIGVREGRSHDAACDDGFEPVSIAEVASRCDLVMMLTPDETHAGILSEQVLPALKAGAAVGFGAGFSVHFGLVRLPEGHTPILVAPKGPGQVLRQRYLNGTGLPALVASGCGERDEGSAAAGGSDTSGSAEGGAEDHATEDPASKGLHMALAYAKGIGSGRAGVVVTTFREEAIADLFGEQCVLAGGMIELMKAAFDVLVDKGYPPEIAYIECIAEVEYMASLISRVGLANLYDNISSTAGFGGATRGKRVIDEATRARLRSILDDIETGKFLEEFKQHVRSGGRPYTRMERAGMLEKARKLLEPDS